LGFWQQKAFKLNITISYISIGSSGRAASIGLPGLSVGVCCFLRADPPLGSVALSMVRHPDFEKIHSAFLAHYSEGPQFGESRYSEWVKAENER